MIRKVLAGWTPPVPQNSGRPGVATDFFHVGTILFKRLYVLSFIDLGPATFWSMSMNVCVSAHRVFGYERHRRRAGSVNGAVGDVAGEEVGRQPEEPH
jgi:hypothetical protein